MKPWDSARALQVCGQNHDKFILGELSISGLHLDGVVADFSKRNKRETSSFKLVVKHNV